MKMKKFLIALLIAVLTAGAISAQQLPLKEVIAHSARGIEETLPHGASVVVTNFSSASVNFSEYVIEELTDEILEGGKITIVDRRNLSQIREEMKLQLSGDVSDESALSIGKLLGAHYIINGTLTNTRFRIRIINVETGVVMRNITNELKTDEQVASLLGIQRPTSNVRDNWVSGELNGGIDVITGGLFGFGARYERMLNSRTSLGANVYVGIPLEPYEWKEQPSTKIDRGIVFGIDASFRFYPMGGKFYLGVGLGYYQSAQCFGDTAVYTESYVPLKQNPALQMTQLVGVAITGELGWKIDVGEEGGFYIEPGFLGSFIIGDEREAAVYGDSRASFDSFDLGKSGHFRIYLGAGWAF